MRTFRLRFLALAGAIALCALGVSFETAGGARADGEVTAPVVTMTPNTGITDGQAVTITVKTSTAQPAFAATASLCRAGVDYQPSTTSRPNVDFESDGANCPGPSHPLSSSSDTRVNDNSVGINGPSPEGESFQFRIGSGLVKWQDTVSGSEAVERTLQCDSTHACVVVVQIRYRASADGPVTWKPYVLPIGYGDADPIAGCGGPADAVLAAGGGDRMTEAWIKWTLAACKREGAVKGAPSRTSFVGEGPGVDGFAKGIYDFAYTGAGYNEDVDLLKPLPDTPRQEERPAVAVPIALNAAVIAVGGGYHPLNADGTVSDRKAAYTDIKMSADEAAAMFSGGNEGVAQRTPDSTEQSPKTYGDKIIARNAQLSGGLYDATAGMAIGAYADGEVFSFYATRFFKTVAPNLWKVPNTPFFETDAGKTRGIDAELSKASPSFSKALSLISGRPTLRKNLIGPGPNTVGGVWVLTDYQTAKALGLTPVKIENKSGEFVEPTPASIAAAVKSMKADDDGVMVSDPSVTEKQDGVTPYPMSFVEYALAPTQPLLEDDCTARTASDALLKDWLTYVTTDGQTNLPAGFVALPDSMKTQAADQIKKVGKAKTTGLCAEEVEETPSTTTTTVASGNTTQTTIPTNNDIPRSSFSDSSLNALSNVPKSNINSNIPGVTTEAPKTITPVAIEKPSIPGFAGAGSAGWMGTLLALVGIVTMSSVALFFSSRAK